MRKGNLTEQEVIRLIGDADRLIAYLLSKPCERTNRVGYNGECQGNAYTEWSASIAIPGTESKLTVYYYTDNEEDGRISDDYDDRPIQWTPHGFDISPEIE